MSLTLSPGKIYLDEQRGFTETEIQQRYCTFNFCDFQREGKEPFGNLYTLNDEVLPAGALSKQTAIHNNYLLLIPITGAVIYTDNTHWMELEPGEALMVALIAGDEFKLSNSYPANWVNYLRIEIKCDELFAGKAARFSFDLDGRSNELIQLIRSPALPFSVHIGRFAGREEAIYHPAGGSAKIFSFVIAGAFELQNRLLHQRDGLALWDAESVEAEALSNNAILLLLELK
jgi:predicted nucleic acid-binding protein